MWGGNGEKMNNINTDFMNFSDMPRRLCRALVSVFEVCLQLLHLLTHATISYLTHCFGLLTVLIWKITIWLRTELHFMRISIKHLHKMVHFALFSKKSISLPNIIDITDIIITRSRHESTSRSSKQAKQSILTSYSAESQVRKHKQ